MATSGEQGDGSIWGGTGTGNPGGDYTSWVDLIKPPYDSWTLLYACDSSIVTFKK